MHSLSQLLTSEVGQQIITRRAMGVPPRSGWPFCNSVHSSVMPCSVLPAMQHIPLGLMRH